MSAKRNAALTVVDELPFDAPAGHVTYRRNASGAIVGMSFGCPCGCGRSYGATFSPGRWAMQGTPEKPTVRPSLGCYETKGPGFHWHGYLTGGVFEEI